jgi:hypothetical protein
MIYKLKVMKAIKMILTTFALLTQMGVCETFYKFQKLSSEGKNCIQIRKMMDELPFLNNYTFDTLKYPIRSHTNRKVSFREVLLKKLFMEEIDLTGIEMVNEKDLLTSYDKLMQRVIIRENIEDLKEYVTTNKLQLDNPMYDIDRMATLFTNLKKKRDDSIEHQQEPNIHSLSVTHENDTDYKEIIPTYTFALNKDIESVQDLILLRNMVKFFYIKQYMKSTDFEDKFFNDFIMKRGSLFTKAKLLKFKVSWTQGNIKTETEKVSQVSKKIIHFSEKYLKEVTSHILPNHEIPEIITEMLEKESKKKKKSPPQQSQSESSSPSPQSSESQSTEEVSVKDTELTGDDGKEKLRDYIKIYQIFTQNQKYLNNFEMNSLYSQGLLDFLLLAFPENTQQVMELYIGAVNAYKSEFILTNLRDKIEDFVLIFKKKNQSINDMKIELPSLEDLQEQEQYIEDMNSFEIIYSDESTPESSSPNTTTIVTSSETELPESTQPKPPKKKNPFKKYLKKFYNKSVLSLYKKTVGRQEQGLINSLESEKPKLELSVVTHLEKINKLIKSYSKERVGKIATLKKNYKERMKLIKKRIMKFKDYVVYINHLFEFFYRMKKLTGYNKSLFEYHNQFLKISSIQQNIQPDNLGDFTLSPDSIDEIDAQIQNLESDRFKGFHLNNLKESPGLSVHSIKTIMLPYEMFFEKNKDKVQKKIFQLKLKLDLVRGLVSLERIIDRLMGHVFADIQQIDGKYQCFVKTDMSHYMFQVMKLNVVIDEQVFMESFYSNLKSDQYIREMVYLNYSTITSDDYLQDLIRKNSAQKIFLAEDKQKLVTKNLYQKHIEHYSLVLNMFKDYMEFRIGKDKTEVNSFGFMKKFKLYFQRFVRTINEKIRNYDLSKDSNAEIIYNFIVERSIYFLTGFIPIVGSIPVARSIISYLVYSIVGTFLKFVVKTFALGLSYIGEVLNNIKFAKFPKDKSKNIAFNYEYYFRKVPVGTLRNKLETIVDFTGNSYLTSIKTTNYEQIIKMTTEYFDMDLKGSQGTSSSSESQNIEEPTPPKRSWANVLRNAFKKNTDEQKLNAYINGESTESDPFGTLESTDFGTEYVFEVFKESFRDIMDMSNEEIINLTKEETKNLSQEEMATLKQKLGSISGNSETLSNVQNEGQFFRLLSSTSFREMETEAMESLESTEHENQVINFDVVEEKFHTNAADKTSLMNIVDSTTLFTEESYLMSEKELSQMKYLLSDEQQTNVISYFSRMREEIDEYIKKKESATEPKVPNSTPQISPQTSLQNLGLSDEDDGFGDEHDFREELSMENLQSIQDPLLSQGTSSETATEIEVPKREDNPLEDFLDLYNHKLNPNELNSKLLELKDTTFTLGSEHSSKISPGLHHFLKSLKKRYEEFTNLTIKSSDVVDIKYLCSENDENTSIVEDYQTSRKFILFKGAFQEDIKDLKKIKAIVKPQPQPESQSQLQDEPERKLSVVTQSKRTDPTERTLTLASDKKIYNLFDDDKKNKEHIQISEGMLALEIQRHNIFLEKQETYYEQMNTLINNVQSKKTEIGILQKYILRALLQDSNTGINLATFSLSSDPDNYTKLLQLTRLGGNSSMDLMVRASQSDANYEYDGLTHDTLQNDVGIPVSAVIGKTEDHTGEFASSIITDQQDLQTIIRNALLYKDHEKKGTGELFKTCSFSAPMVTQGFVYPELTETESTGLDETEVELVFSDKQSRIKMGDTDGNDETGEIVLVDPPQPSTDEQDDLTYDMTDIKIKKYLDSLDSERGKTKFTLDWGELPNEDRYKSQIYEMLKAILKQNIEETESTESNPSQGVLAPSQSLEDVHNLPIDEDPPGPLVQQDPSEDVSLDSMFVLNDVQVAGKEDVLTDFSASLPSVVYKFDINRFKKLLEYLESSEEFQFSQMNMVLYFRSFGELPETHVIKVESNSEPEDDNDMPSIPLDELDKDHLLFDRETTPQIINTSLEEAQKVPNPIVVSEKDLETQQTGSSSPQLTESQTSPQQLDESQIISSQQLDEIQSKDPKTELPSPDMEDRKLFSSNFNQRKNLKQVKKVEKFII